MDGILISLSQNKISYAAANNKPIIIRNGQIIELAADKMHVGSSPKENISFTNFSAEVQKNDLLYLFTDGYADQFGGPKGKKFKHKTLSQLLLTISNLTLEEQKEKLENTFNDWKGNLEQIDDICMIGIKI
jgi:serine phosphatase RsbU (regulator of sigma subunit)